MPQKPHLCYNPESILRTSEQSLGGCGVGRGLQVTFRGDGGLGAAFGGGIGVEGVRGHVGDC